MNLSLNAIASIVINSTFGGLKAVTNIPLSIDQVKDEISTMRNRILKQMIDAGQKNFEGLYSKIACIKLECRDMAECCEVEVGTMVLGGKLPKLFDQLMGDKTAIKYAGSPSMYQPFRILTGNEYIYHMHSPLVGNKPAAYIDYNQNVWVINPPTMDMEYLSVVVILEDPRDLQSFSCCAATDDDPYPIPSWMVDEITGKLINDYIRYYTSTQTKPNTQSPTENQVQQQQ
jgi:hypothetical protein